MQGDWLGGYRLLRRLGAGGAGTVWEAEDGGGEHVALKLVHPALAQSEEARVRLAREAATLNAVRSPGVARVLDVETEDVQPFVVTELIDGPTLAQEIAARGPATPSDTARLGRELASTLSAVHAKHVIHRDIKPSNIILAGRGPVLIDFGVAQNQDDDRLTATGLVTGTAGYTSPNMLRAGQATPADDRWSLAATLLHTVTGRPPFGAGEPQMVLSRVLDGDPDVDGLDPTIAEAFRRCLAPGPDPLGLTALMDVLDGGALPAPSQPSQPTQSLQPAPSDQPTEAINLPAGPAPVPTTGPATEVLSPYAPHAPYAPPVEPTGPDGDATAHLDPSHAALPPTSAMPASPAPSPAPAPAPVPNPAPVPAPMPAQVPAPYPQPPVGQGQGSAPAPSSINWMPPTQDPLGAQLQPAYLPQKPRSAAVLGAAMSAALAMLPVASGMTGTVTAALVLVLLSVVGTTQSTIETRRFRHGGPRSSDIGVGLARTPLALLIGLLRIVASLTIGVLVGAAVWGGLVVSGVLGSDLPLGLPLQMATAQGSNVAAIADGSYLGDAAYSLQIGSGLVVLVVWACLAVAMVVAWAFPTSDHARRGLGLMAQHMLAPRWTRVLVGLILIASVPLTWWVLTGGAL